jgi:Zn-dependent peptidase ImmA (M78 family)
MGAIGNKPKKFRTAETYDEPEMLADLDSIRKKAKEEGYVDGYKFDVEKFIKDKYPDIKILKVALSSDVSGKLEYKDGVWMMSVNLQHPEVRQRYTLGHELGHYLNHRDSVKSFEDTIYFRNKQKSSMEYMADQFAARLLMPENDVNELVKSGVKTVKEMSLIFGVSLEAMKYRLEQLGYGIKKSE